MIKAIVTTAINLSAKQRDSLKEGLEKALKDKVTLEETVDPQIVGGLRLRVGSQEFDGTVVSKLSQVRQHLITQL